MTTMRMGELAALGTSISWTIAALVMEQAVRRVGVMAVNTLKVAFGSLYLALFSLAINGFLFPLTLPATAWLFLSASGLVGFVVGDYFLLHSYRIVGSRLAMLLMSLSVPLTTIGARLLFGETLETRGLGGMALCIGGIALTIAAGRPPETNRSHAKESGYVKGVAFGVLSAFCMALATLFTKAGAAGIDSISATQVRIMSALVGFLAFALITKKSGEIISALRQKTGYTLIPLGAVFGPFIGVGLLLFAVQNADTGLVSTLSSLSPILIIPPAAILFRRKIKFAEIAGACAAVAGLALIFL